MKQFLDFFPLIAFLIVYKLDERLIHIGSFDYTLGGVFSATEILVATTLLVYGGSFLKNRSLSKTQWITLGGVVLFCSFTILFRSEAILKWKAPAVNWIFAAIFAGSHFIGDKNAIQRMLGHAITLPQAVWIRLNWAWAGCFLFVGCTNLFVAFTFHEWWVDFKVFGSLGILLLFNIGQIFYIAPYLKDSELEDTEQKGSRNDNEEQAQEI